MGELIRAGVDLRQRGDRETRAPLAESRSVRAVLPCDLTQGEDIAATFAALGAQWGRVDVVVHAVAFALRFAIPECRD